MYIWCWCFCCTFLQNSAPSLTAKQSVYDFLLANWDLKRTYCAHCRAIYLFWNSTGLALHHTLLHIYLKSIFTPVVFSPFKSNSGLFSPFVGFCCSHQRLIWPISELNILWIFSVWKETKWEGKTTRLKTHHLIWARVEKLLLQTPLH